MFKIAYPVSPVSINQPFGGNPDYYKKFHDKFGNAFKGHNGVDLMAYHGQPLYAPCDGEAFYLEDSHGGCGIFIDTPDLYRITLFHLCGKDDIYKPLIRTDGGREPVKKGQHIGYCDNSGAPYESSGDHLHFGVSRIDSSGNVLNQDNGFNGNIDPWPLFSGESALPKPKLPDNTEVPYEQALDNLMKSGLPLVIRNMAIWVLKKKYGRV